jgi:hypothetical protein
VTRELDKVQARMLFDWSKRPADMIVEEELAVIEALINNAIDAHYGDDTTLDLTLVTYEGRMDEDADDPGWHVDPGMIWRRIPGDTEEEKSEWLRRKLGGD